MAMYALNAMYISISIQIVKPPRSRHCNICKACISVYDHHCPWIGNCVGNRNYLFFFIFLSVLAVYLIYNIIFHILSNIYLNVELIMIL